MPAPVETLPGTQALDGPPPNPAQERGASTGVSFNQLAPGGAPTPSGQLPPEVLKGMLEAAEGMAATYDQFAELTPQWGNDWGLAKAALLDVMAKVVGAGAPPTAPTAVGGNFPGGGFDRGGMPQATGGI